MSRHLKNFSINNIDGMIDCLNDYKAYINDKANEFVRELADVGIRVAQGHLGEWNNYIFFERLDEENGTIIVATPFSIDNNCVSSNHVLKEREFISVLILSSKLQTAKKFKRWVTGEVLPQIRKTGNYSTMPKPERNC